MKAEQFDKTFDQGEDVTTALDMDEARRLGVTHQAVIKVWIADRLEKSRLPAA